MMARDEIGPACVRDLRNIPHEKRRIRDLRKTCSFLSLSQLDVGTLKALEHGIDLLRDKLRRVVARPNGLSDLEPRAQLSEPGDIGARRLCADIGDWYR